MKKIIILSFLLGLLLAASACQKSETDDTQAYLAVLLSGATVSSTWSGSGCAVIVKRGSGPYNYLAKALAISSENCNEETLGSIVTTDADVAKTASDVAHEEVKTLLNTYPSCAPLVADVETAKNLVTAASITADAAGKTGDLENLQCVFIDVGSRIEKVITGTPGRYCSDETQAELLRNRRYLPVTDMRVDFRVDIEHRIQARTESLSFNNFRADAVRAGRPMNLSEYRTYRTTATAAYFVAEVADTDTLDYSSCRTAILQGNPELRAILLGFYGATNRNKSGLTAADAQAVDAIKLGIPPVPVLCGYLPEVGAFVDSGPYGWGRTGECPGDYPRF